MDDNAGPPAGHDSRPRSSPMAGWHGLVRPRQGRYIAGVCVALGRATGTDPVLWRVLLAVLVCFGGIGVLAYLGLWLLTPEEGDTASPVEAVLGRGHSATPSLLVIVLAIIAMLSMLVALSRPGYVVLLGAAVALVVVLIQRQRQQSRPEPPPPGPGPGSGTPLQPPPDQPTPAAPTPATPEATPPAATPPSDARAEGGPPVAAPPEATTPEATPAAATPEATPPAVTVPLTTPAPFAGPRPYPEAFAPHGPFAYSAPPRPTAPPPPRPPKERSMLPALTFFCMLSGLGVLGMLDLTGVTSIPATGYLAGGLVVVGAGLLVGAWMGRGRSLIVLGVVLALALPTVHAAATWTPPEHVATNVQWRPTDAVELQPEYALAFGEGVLDLREIDFAGARHEVTARVNGGEIRIQVPPDVPLTVTVDARAGNATIFDTETIAGLDTRQTFEYPAIGEPVDGELILNVQVRFGHIEVTR